MKPKTSKALTSKPSRKSGASLFKSSLKQRVRTPEEEAEATRSTLTALGLPAKEQIKFVDPITKEVKLINIDRTGHNEGRLITALADPELSRDRKDHELSMYLFGRGAEGADFMLDLVRSKGQHTKETRVFKSQIRYDFEAVVKIIADHFGEQAMRAEIILGVNLKLEMSRFRDWLKLPNNKGTEATYWDYRHAKDLVDNPSNRMFCLAVSEAIFNLSESTRLTESRQKIAQAREAEKGGGVYVDKSGRVYSVNDEEVDAIIKADREATREIEKP